MTSTLNTLNAIQDVVPKKWVKKSLKPALRGVAQGLVLLGPWLARSINKMHIRRSRSSAPMTFLAAGLGLGCGIGIGAGLVYLFDPQHGRERRDQLNDQLRRAGERVNEKLAEGKQILSDLPNRISSIREGQEEVSGTPNLSEGTSTPVGTRRTAVGTVDNTFASNPNNPNGISGAY